MQEIVPLQHRQSAPELREGVPPIIAEHKRTEDQASPPGAPLSDVATRGMDLVPVVMQPVVPQADRGSERIKPPSQFPCKARWIFLVERARQIEGWNSKTGPPQPSKGMDKRMKLDPFAAAVTVRRRRRITVVRTIIK
jgi:hypothetical protein